jgi:hypothetical protein
VVASADEAIVGDENEKPLRLYAHRKRSIPTVQLTLLETCAFTSLSNPEVTRSCGWSVIV